jgi:hypothetical protein
MTIRKPMTILMEPIKSKVGEEIELYLQNSIGIYDAASLVLMQR